MCVACGLDIEKLGINKPFEEGDPNNWLDLCATELFERIVGYNSKEMSDMMYPYMLGKENPIDFLYKKFKKIEPKWLPTLKREL